MSTARSTSNPTTGKTPAPAQAVKTTQPSTQPSPTTPKLPCERIAQRAYEKWMKRGCVHGFDQQDWTDAEKELMLEQSKSTAVPAGGARR